MWTTTLDNLLAHKLRVLATSLAVLVGVAFMAGTMVLTDTMGRSLDDLFEDLYSGTDAVVRAEPAFENTDPFGGAARARIEEGLVDSVRSVEGVAHAFGDMQGFAQIVGADGEPLGNPGLGAPTFGIAWPDVDELNPLDLVEGRGPEAGDEAVIDVGSARAGELGVGDVTQVLTAQGPADITIVGLVRWTDADSPLGASVVAFTPDYAQGLISEPGKVRQVLVMAEDGISQTEIRDRVAAAVPRGIEVVTGAQITAEDQSLARRALGFFGSFMLTFAVVALFVGCFIIHNTYSILVARRNREMALLRAIGASRRQVLWSLLLEASVVGVVASVLGLATGIVFAFGLKELLDVVGLEVPARGLVVTWRTAIVALVAGVVVSVAAAVAPARRASRIPPVAAMSEVAFIAVERRRLRTVRHGDRCRRVDRGAALGGSRDSPRRRRRSRRLVPGRGDPRARHRGDRGERTDLPAASCLRDRGNTGARERAADSAPHRLHRGGTHGGGRVGGVHRHRRCVGPGVPRRHHRPLVPRRPGRHVGRVRVRRLQP
ncbi:MAG: FtsX-like permease family protein [Acidimicrobiales bacterium]